MAELLERLQQALADRYAVERELGRGGMATVYLAEERHPQRHVAIKVLDPALATVLGPERFLREVDLASKLAHPHILPIYAAAEADGLLYYVMPYVEGESLRDRLTREKQLPLDDALQISREVADALSYAHAHGVVHRDIKPENILLESGHAVVADFGIAKAVSAAGGARLTETGLAIGTPAYMSPEQAAGSHDLDGRSDIYSLACVLYEMLAGDAPYVASTPQAVIAKKLSEPLPHISVVREAVPPGIEAALNKALARTPADRYATAQQFGEVLAHPETAGASIAAPRAPAWRRLGRLAAAAGSVIALGALAVLGYDRLRAKPLNITASGLTQVTNDPGVEFQPAISPDGNEVAYVGGGIERPRLFIRSAVNAAASAAVRLGDTTLASEWFPSWTPDGEHVRFYGCRGGLGEGCAYREVAKLGGVTQIVPVGGGRWLTYWSPDGGRVAFRRGDTMLVSSSTDTVPRPVEVDSSNRPHSFAWSPDGRLIAYVRGNPEWLNSGNVQATSLWVVSAAGGEPQPVASADQLNVSPAWLDDRHLLYVSDRDGERAVYAVEVGPHGERGTPRIVPGVLDPHSISYSIAARKLAYAKFTLQQNIRAYPLARPTPMSIRAGRPVTSGAQVIEYHDVSRDGRWITYCAYLRGRLHVYKIASSGGQPVPLTSGEEEQVPNWSPDGREIAFNRLSTAGAKGRISQVEVVPAEGGSPAPVTSGWNPRYSPDGLRIAFAQIADVPNRGPLSWTWTLARDSVGGPWHGPQQLARIPLQCTDWTPDGAALACYDWRLLPLKLALVSARDGRVLRSDLLAASGLAAGGNARFSQDGRSLYAWGIGRDGRQGVWVIPMAGGPARLVVAFDDPTLLGANWLSVGPDRLYLTVSDYESDIWVATLKW
jgi:serine/threonine-protein kinase